jgi:hypothetical protein
MNDLPRLRLVSNQAACRLLLESARGDHSAPGAAERALYALGVGTAATAAAAVHVGTSSGVGSHFASSIALKWLGLGLLAGSATLVSAEQAVRMISESRATGTARVQANEKSTTRQPEREAITAAAPNVPESPPLTPKAQRLESSGSRAADPPPAADRASEADADPLQELRTIRRALAEHAPARALTLLDSFVTRHPASSLLEEAAVLRFDALSALGSSQARAEGEAFLRRYPRSAYAERVRIKLLALP